VLLIDYCAKEHAGPGRKKIVAQEFCDIDSLRRFYRKEDMSAQAALRVIHVQNASWATRFLLRKFNIDASDDLVGTTFGRWARYERPQQRGGKPVLNGKTFRTQRDPWRGISRASFGCDYLKHYGKGSISPPGIRPMMELNHYDETDQPCYGFDVYVQRLSVYVQLSDGRPGQAVDPDIPNPYNEEAYEEYQRLKKSYGNVDANEHQERYIPKLRTLDNSNTIIIFENSQSGSVKDTLIGARQELESRWRRLTFYLPREDMDNDDTLATECMDFILKDIFKALAYNWNRFVGACETHVGILEDKSMYPSAPRKCLLVNTSQSTTTPPTSLAPPSSGKTAPNGSKSNVSSIFTPTLSRKCARTSTSSRQATLKRRTTNHGSVPCPTNSRN
jgi:hypothetical protein